MKHQRHSARQTRFGGAVSCTAAMLCLGLLGVACADDTKPDDSSGHAGAAHKKSDYASIRAADGAGTTVPLSLCGLVRHPMFGPAGLYKVETLTGATEEDLWNPGTRSGFTYVKLALLDSWYEADENPVTARILGLPSGTVRGWDLTLAVDDVVGLLLMKPVAENRDHYGLHWLGTFRIGQNGGYTNGQLFTKRVVDAEELGNLVSGLAGGDPGSACAYDEQPDYGSTTDSEDGGEDSTF